MVYHYYKMGKRLVKIENTQNLIFVGDTHGDLEASKKIIEKFLKKENKIVFLGDYVDRGKESKENIDFLLKLKNQNPKKIFLLQGNHEGYKFLKFSPADFWENLSQKEFQKYSSIFEKFPLALIAKNIIALHGALPDLKNLNEFEKIKLGDENWFKICWGDFVEDSKIRDFSLRPKFDKFYFFKMMERFQKKVLIRSHDLQAPLFMFENKCLTIFSSSVYKKQRLIAIFNFKKEIKSAKDLKILRI